VWLTTLFAEQVLDQTHAIGRAQAYERDSGSITVGSDDLAAHPERLRLIAEKEVELDPRASNVRPGYDEADAVLTQIDGATREASGAGAIVDDELAAQSGRAAPFGVVGEQHSSP